MVDKNYCMSSFLTFRYIEDSNKEFYEGLHHTGDMPYPEEKKVLVHTAADIKKAYTEMFAEKQKDVKLGIMLSGGMDSACLAACMKPGTDAYTFRFLDATFSTGDMERAKLYAEKYKLNLHYVDINWEVVQRNLPALMKTKGAPVHSIEPQIMEAALQAKKDGVEMMVAADGSDLVFGGMDKMLSKDWTFDEWVDFYTFVDPKKVLREPVSMLDVYERFRLPNNMIDFLRFQDEIFAHESSASYCNAFITAGMKYTPFFDPSGMVKMADPLDLKRVRNGESKYLIRELFHMCYPEFPIPEKVPMPRPVDVYFKDWQGPTRPEFRRDIDMSSLTGNQKWLLYCLEQFLNMHEPLKIGYTTGVYDLFHIGHLNLLRKAKAQCDYLIVGVSTDDLVEYKGKRSVIPFEERKEIVGAIKYVDEVVTQEDMDKLGAWKKYHFDVMFVGDDWKGTDKWNKIEAELKEVGAKVVYFPYTKGTSSTLINETLVKLREKLMSIKKNIKQFIPSRIWGWLHDWRNRHAKKKQLVAYQQHYNAVIERLKTKMEPLNVLFMAIYGSNWKYDSVYQLMLKDPRFNPIILVCPDVDRGREHMLEVMNSCCRMFDQKGYTYVRTYDEKTNTYVDAHSYQPDIIFYTSPYDWLIDGRYYLDKFPDSLTCYVDYSYEIMNTQWSYTQPLQKKVWKYFVPTKYHKGLVERYNKCTPRNIEVSGYPMYDVMNIHQKHDNFAWKDKTKKHIVWAPHQSINDISPDNGIGVRWSTFLLFAEFMRNLAEKYEEEIEIVFKPHPLLKHNLYNHPDWGEKKTDDYYNSWTVGNNTILLEGDYVDAFVSSDALIHDCGSFSIEYLYTQNPCMHLSVYTDGTEFNEIGRKAIGVHYKGLTGEDIEMFILNVIINGDDPKKQVRKEFYSKYLMPPQECSVAQKIVNCINIAIQ